MKPPIKAKVPTRATIRNHLRTLRTRRRAVPGRFGLRVTAGPGALRLALTGVSRRCVGGRYVVGGGERAAATVRSRPEPSETRVRARPSLGRNVDDPPACRSIYRVDRLFR